MGEYKGWLEVLDIQTYNITSAHKFSKGDTIRDIIEIDDNHYFLAALNGLLKTTKDKLIKHYYDEEVVTSLCHITDSKYLVGFENAKLVVWDEKKEQEMYQIIDDGVYSIKRVMRTDNYIISKRNDGVKLLNIFDLQNKKFTVQHLLDVKDECVN